MQTSVREFIDEKILVMLDEVDRLEPGSKERSAIIDDISKLVKLCNDEDHNEDEYALKKMQTEQQKKRDTQESNDKKWTRWISIGSLGIALFDLGKDVICYLWGLNFEEAGTITSPHLRQNISKLFRRHEPPRIQK